MYGRVRVAQAIDVPSGRTHQTSLNGFVGDPIGRLLRDAARGLGYARPEDIELRLVCTRTGYNRDFERAWAEAVAPTPDAVRLVEQMTLHFLVKPRDRSDGGGGGGHIITPPQRVTAVEPAGYHLHAAFSHSAADPAADLRESIADAGGYCTGDCLELRIVNGVLPPLPPHGDPCQPPHVVREAWERGSPLFPDRMPAPGQAVAVGFVDVPNLPPEKRCGTCMW
jgi:hypothetical protein